ncbi:HesB/IscA family protein [Trichocoleus desertorum]|uniref:HesB/IscA family protein n=1 Tax=Trichocoleus desertorum TaxID=1481672 RepID=UPI00329A523E
MMLQLSQAAIKEILRLKQKCHKPDAVFRLGVQPSGCSGMSYTLEFDEEVGLNDALYDCNGIQVAIARSSLTVLSGLNLDYSEDLMGGGFRFHNPNATQSCGCGNSFSVS